MHVYHKRWQKLWKKAAYTIIAKKYKALLLKKKGNSNPIVEVTVDAEKRRHQEWRLGYNLYKCGEFHESFEILEKICAGGEEGIEKRANGESSLDDRSHVHHATGLCCVALFNITHLHIYLEKAYDHYQNSVSTMIMDMYAMFKLPETLLEFGRVMEQYGSFESALELYTRILTNFPNSGRYFDAMYRSAIVGKHIADFATENTHKEDAINKCIDILQFLLEAIPPNIDEIHIVFLYARTLEESSNQSNRFRSNAVYESLYRLCYKHRPPLGNANTHRNFKEWMNDPITWHTFSKDLEGSHESLLVREAHDKLLELSEELQKKGKDVSHVLKHEQFLEIAKNHAKFQNYEHAIKYAEMALEMDHFQPEAREQLAKWSVTHRKEFEKEKNAVDTITDMWKHRIWVPSFSIRLKDKILKENEELIHINHFDYKARKALEYYARDTYRPQFLYENYCASRIQNIYKTAKLRWSWQSPIRSILVKRANELYKKYKRSPYNAQIRNDIIKVLLNGLCPKNHQIYSLNEIFKKLQSLYRRRRSYVTLQTLKEEQYMITKRLQAREFLAWEVPRLIRAFRAKGVYQRVKWEREERERLFRYMNRPEKLLAHKRWKNSISYAIDYYHRKRKEESAALFHLTMSLIRARKIHGLSTLGVAAVSIISNDVHAQYYPPGINKSSTQYVNLLRQQCVLCKGSFTPVDALMLSNVLKNKSCEIQHITMLNVEGVHKNFNVELLEAIRLKSLSLHDLGIRGYDLLNLLVGLRCNRCLQTLCLSRNLLEDKDLIDILEAIMENNRHMIEKLDFSWNFIRGNNSLLHTIKTCFQKIANRNMKVNCKFEIFLENNPLQNIHNCNIIHRNGIQTVVDITAVDISLYQKQQIHFGSSFPQSPSPTLLLPTSTSTSYINSVHKNPFVLPQIITSGKGMHTTAIAIATPPFQYQHGTVHTTITPGRVRPTKNRKLLSTTRF
eukprot:gene2135-4165_t